MNRSLTRAAALVFTAAILPAQTMPASAPPLFSRADVFWSAAFLAGSLGLSTADVRISRYMAAHQSDTRNTVARDVAKAQEGTLTVGNLLLYGVGRLAHMPTLADVTFHAAESVVVGSVASQIIRGPLGRARPYDSPDDQYNFHWFQGFTNFKYRAFPSIHTASAFAVATVYTLETKRRAPGATWIVGPITYALAAAPGIARLYQNQHWASDILSGAFMGVLSGATVVRYNHVVKPTNRINRFFLGANNVQAGLNTSGLEFSYSF